MSAGAQAQRWDQPSRRSLPRYRVQAPLDVTVLRSGIPDTLPGRSLNLCERGLAAMLAGELALGEAVGVELLLPWTPDPLRARAVVRHHDRLRFGLEFIGLTLEQRAAIRTWAERSKAEPDSIALKKALAFENKTLAPETVPPAIFEAPIEIPVLPALEKVRPMRRARFALLALALAAVLLAIFWWRWNRVWQELESGLPRQKVSSEQPVLHVAAEEMQKLVVHRVDPDYPPAARQANLQAVIVLDVVIGRDGAVTGVRPLNGPDVLARAATDALRWWKFEPYKMNGQPVPVETTVAVEFNP